jgi:hypothetical protein
MAISRRKYGTGHAYYVDGEKIPGVTTVLKVLPINLAGWASRVTAEYALDNWATLSEMPLSERLREMTGARGRTLDKAARRGTEVHRLAEQLVAEPAELTLDEEPPGVLVPEELRGHVEAYRDWLDTIQPSVLATELVVASRTHRYCGTADLVADLPELLMDMQIIPPSRWLLELKTTASGVWPESALQATAYRRADMYVHPEHPEVEQPMAQLGIERAGVVWIKSDACELRPVDTSDELWEFFLHARWMYDRFEKVEGSSDIRLPSGWLGSAATTGELIRNS